MSECVKLLSNTFAALARCGAPLFSSWKERLHDRGRQRWLPAAAAPQEHHTTFQKFGTSAKETRMKSVNFSRKKSTAAERKCCHMAAKLQFEYVTSKRQQDMKTVEGACVKPRSHLQQSRRQLLCRDPRGSHRGDSLAEEAQRNRGDCRFPAHLSGKNVYAYPPGAPPCRSRAEVFKRKLFVVVLNIMGVVVAVPQFAQSRGRQCARSIAGRTHKLSALMQHNKAAAFVFGGSHGVAPGHGGSIVTDVFTAGGVGFTGMSSVAPCCFQALWFSL